MTLSTKSLAKSSVSEKKVRASRKVKVDLPLIEEVKEDEVKEEEPVLEPVLEPVFEVLEVQSVTIEAGANACCESMQEVACPPCDEQIEEPITLAKKCAKVRPQVDENGNYLNPLTNRYVKFGSSNFKKLLQQGIIKPRELNNL
jgi:hypothetical protein